MFKMESFFWKLMVRIGDILLLSFLCFVSSLAIFTLPAAVVALFITAQQTMHERDLSIVKSYYQNFFSAFKKNTLPGNVLLLITVLYFKLLKKLAVIQQSWAQFGGIILLLLLPVAILLLLYFLPQIGKKSDPNVFFRLKWSFYLAFRHLPWSTLLMALFAGSIWLTLKFMPLLFFTLAAFVFVNCRIVNKLSLYSFNSLNNH